MKMADSKCNKKEYLPPYCEIVRISSEARMMVPASAGQEDYEYKDFWEVYS